jgi:hypothetical protein
MLHEKYTHSAAIKQILIKERISLEQLAQVTGIKLQDLHAYLSACKEMSINDMTKILQQFLYMKGRID